MKTISALAGKWYLSTTWSGTMQVAGEPSDNLWGDEATEEQCPCQFLSPSRHVHLHGHTGEQPGGQQPVPALERQWYQGVLHPIPTLAPLPLIFSLTKIWEPDLHLTWVRGWFMLSEGSERLHSQFLICKINWADLMRFCAMTLVSSALDAVTFRPHFSEGWNNWAGNPYM